MNDLPSSSFSGGGNLKSQITSSKQDVIGSAPLPIGGLHGKEVEIVGGPGEFSLTDVGAVEMELPKEVSAVGVSVHQTTVSIPPNVAQMGVKHAGAHMPTVSMGTTAFPLTNDQITTGLRQGLTSSFRWLAEWCARKLKQIHKKITNPQ